ncbi:DUF4365 domain-containing protein [Pontibacter anaerobius]|uniref:DUF4365 domain-containing protein n=1 Tax=Pontibacter anaerobius TaxID=2993940 RepID=A0ABT3RIJ4_9BACT|nr:DUF4365 domain-containing protein [Pontibacter anaerobius]MCX2741447.1 DUF4365 domain-containing protein [Pontibacter anaerobius]
MHFIKYDKGALGEALVGNLLSIIFNGEVQKLTLRGEGTAAMDLDLSYPTPFGTQTTRKLAFQVKTGKSYARWHKTRSEWVMQNIKDTHIKKWQNMNLPALLVWVNPLNKPEVYWKFIKADTPSTYLRLSKNHKLRPEAIFEIDRLSFLAYKQRKKMPIINLKKVSLVSDARKHAKKKLKKIKGVHKTDFVNVEISNYVLKHLTRASKNKTHIKDSLTLLPHVPTFLKHIPHYIETTESTDDKKQAPNEHFEVIKRKVSFVYKNVDFDDMRSAVVTVRFKETIIYPKDWETNWLLNKQIQHSLILESIYRKS